MRLSQDVLCRHSVQLTSVWLISVWYTASMVSDMHSSRPLYTSCLNRKYTVYISISAIHSTHAVLGRVQKWLFTAAWVNLTWKHRTISFATHYNFHQVKTSRSKSRQGNILKALVATLLNTQCHSQQDIVSCCSHRLRLSIGKV